MSENKQTHPMYGVIGISRTTGGAHNLFGSSVPCNSTIRITLKRSEVERDCHTEWFHGKENLFEIAMSPAQFAEMITNMNCGEGVPCTIIYDGTTQTYRPLAECPYEPQFDQYNNEFKETCKNINHDVNAMIKKAEDILSQKTVKKSDINTLMALLGALSTDLNSNLPFVQESFNEYLNNSVSDAKQEIDAFMQHRLMQYGVDTLKKIETTNKENRPELEEQD